MIAYIIQQLQMSLNLSYVYKPIYALPESIVPKLKFILLNALDHNVPHDSYLQTPELKQIRMQLSQAQIEQLKLVQAIQVIFTLLSRKQNENHEGNEESYQQSGGEKEYMILQSLVQKQEANNRNHIKLEQQMQLYLQSLQDKIHQLEYKLNLETTNNRLLTQKNKMMELQLNTLKSYKSKPSLKEKTIMDKIVARAEKISNQQLQNKLFFRQSRIKPNQNPLKNQFRSRIWLHDRNIRRKNTSQEALMKNLSNSVNTINQRRKINYRSQKKVISAFNVCKIPQRSSFSHLG